MKKKEQQGNSNDLSIFIRYFRDLINEYSLIQIIQSQTLRILHFLARIVDVFFRISRQIPERVTPSAFSIKFAKTN